MLAPHLLHPAVHDWFTAHFPAPTPAQADAWPAIESGNNVLIAAPTGSGKTLAAFLMAIDSLVRQGVQGALPDETQVVYVSPLKALSNDIQKNLEFPLAGIRDALRKRGLPDVGIRSWVRTGDTPQKERAHARKQAPHIVVTTPESLYILLGSESGRTMLATTRMVIVDEIHALAPNKRGSHLALSLARLQALCGDKLQRVGLSATQKPIEEVAHFLVGSGENDNPSCTIIDAGHKRVRDLRLEVPPSPLEAVMSGEQWTQVYDRLAALINEHRTTLVFVNTRRLVERVSRELSARLGEDQLAAHHGSLSREQRLDAEQRLKHGKLKALVATASLELGIDIGDVDLVCQLSSPRSIAAFLQRVGRSGHAVNATPKGRLFPLSRDELVECAALLASVERGELDRLAVPEAPLDVLAQQIVAEVAAQDWNEDDLYALFRRAWPYRNLSRGNFSQVITMLAEGFSTRRGRRGALLHHDSVNHMLRGRRGARLTAITSGGAIPDNADYRVLLEPENQFIGTVHEDFAVESLAGDVFQLGNQSYRIMRVERGTVRVEDARGQPPTIPFWLGEAPGRSDELSHSVSRLRGEIVARMDDGGAVEDVSRWLKEQPGITEPAASDLAAYLTSSYGALGCLPTQETLVFERFFDDSGGMQLVIHSPYGSRINRAWGLALRKRFCRKFNFELQAAATEDNIVLSLSASHSFDLAEVRHYLRAANVREILIETLLDAPMFATRWRWVAGTALALPRFQGGKKRAPQLIRMDAEDLVAAIFPDQLACAENLVGAREIPDHPLVRQTIDDCLHDAMDIDGLEALLNRLESGEVRVVAKDLTEPSPLAMEVLAARPYAYLDDAPLEERRTQAVQARRWIDPETASDLGRLDADAIARVRDEIKSDPRNSDELHDTMAWLGYLTESEAAAGGGAWEGWLTVLAGESHVTQLAIGNAKLWIAAERLPQFRAVWPAAELNPPIAIPAAYAERQWSAEEALVEIVRGRLEGSGPLTIDGLAVDMGLAETTVMSAMLALESEGFVLRGHFTPGATEEEWCERRLLARIHRYTLKRLRAEIEPVAPRDFLRFLLEWQHVAGDTRMEGADAATTIIGQLEGFEVPASAWESDILPARLTHYKTTWLDRQSLAGRVTWTSLRRRNDRATAAPIRTTPIVLMTRRHANMWSVLSPPADINQAGGDAQTINAYLQNHGASFFDEIVEGSGLLRVYAEQALGELATLGLVTSDSFGGLRALIDPVENRISHRGHSSPMEQAGRWSLVNRAASPISDGKVRAEAVEYAAQTLLRRYGVVFWRLLEREPSWLPSWRELLAVFRRLEARGEIRGGRFVSGFAGEQFALPEAIGLLRDVKRREGDGKLVSISGADPLNLVGILTPGAKLPAISGNRVLYRDGMPIAVFAGGEARSMEGHEITDWALRKALLRSPSLAGGVDADTFVRAS